MATLSKNGKPLGRPKGSKNSKKGKKRVAKPPPPALPRTPHDDSMYLPANLNFERPEVPKGWGEFQSFSVDYWERTYGKESPHPKLKFIAPVLPTPTNRWKFHGFVALPPKPIPNKGRLFPHFYLTLAHSPKRQLEGGRGVEARVTVGMPVTVVGEMLGEVAVKYGYLAVGTEVVAIGRFSNKRTTFGDRTVVLVEEVLIVKESGEEDGRMGAEDRETLRVLQGLEE